MSFRQIQHKFISFREVNVAITVILISFLLYSCDRNQSGSIDCSFFANEVYLTENFAELGIDINETREFYLSQFDASSIKGHESEAYQMVFYSTHRFGRVIKIEKTPEGALLSSKCLEHPEAGYYCFDGQLELDSSAWHTFHQMIYEFNYWTEPQVKYSPPALDGYGFVLEGVRPSAHLCKKKSYNIVIRGSALYDKIAALCGEIMNFEDNHRPVTFDDE